MLTYIYKVTMYYTYLVCTLQVMRTHATPSVERLRDVGKCQQSYQ